VADAPKKKSMLQELKEFIMRGNVIDLAVGVAVGAAFTAMVNSVVNDLINPLIGLMLGGLDFANLSFAIGDATFTYGNLIMSIINFLAVATVLFFVIKAFNMLSRKEAKKPEPPPGPTPDQKLLTEIRDLLAATSPASVKPPVTD
jgi:large conductance mechanosensitive channel